MYEYRIKAINDYHEGVSPWARIRTMEAGDRWKIAS